MPTDAARCDATGRFGLFIVVAIFLLLFGFGSTPASGGLVAAPWDKLVHLGVFASLAIGLRILLPRQSIILITILTLSIGAADELHQIFVPNRQPDLDDWLADLAGTAVGLLCWLWLKRLPFFSGSCRP